MTTFIVIIAIFLSFAAGFTTCAIFSVSAREERAFERMMTREKKERENESHPVTMG